ncbi:MAG: ABC transporter substrate-binding protein [Shinella sp.]|uniref:ABC transporter substrate-binding protein n=1 Tax=Shinella sp. TaxID=1870904 RepID=UPI003C752B21
MKKMFVQNEIRLHAARARHAALLSAVAGSILMVAMAGGAQAQDSITVNAYSGPWELAMRKCFFEPFSAETGIQVVVETGTASVTFAKLRQQKDSPTIDVAWLDAGYSEQAWDEGLTQEVSATEVPNLSNLSKQAVYATADGKVYGVGTGYFAYTLVYDPKKVDPAPTSYFDLWDPKYEQRVYSPAPAQSLFTPLMMHLNKMLGGTDDNFEPFIEKFSQLKPSSYYEASGVMNVTIQSGEVVMGIYYPNTAWQLFDQGVSITTGSPKEGVVASDIRMHLVAGTTKKALAERLMNFVSQPKPLECIGEEIYLGPPLDNPTLSEKASQRMPWGAGGKVSDLIMPDWHVVNAKRQQLRDLWNRRVVSQ